MAQMKVHELLKRDNAEIFLDRALKGGFQESAKSPVYKSTGVMKVGKIIYDKTNWWSDEDFRRQLELHDSKAIKMGSIQVQVLKNERPHFLSLSKIFKDSEFGGIAGKSSKSGSERQELGLISAINTAAKVGEYSVAPFKSNEFLVSAEKREGLSSIGKEPYIDVYVKTNKKTYGVSCKGKSAPSLAGGGVAGLEVIVPKLTKALYKTLEDHLKNTLKLKQDSVVDLDVIPDLYIPIPKEFIREILVGNEKMGGPIDLMYIGQMDVMFTLKSKKINLNGDFFNIEQYMKKVPNLFFRVRKRDIGKSEQIRIEFNKKNRQGYPILLSLPNSTQNVSRIVISNNVPSNGLVINLKR